MTRFTIMTGYVFLFFYLHQSGNLSKYINVKYAYLSEIAIVVLSLLCVVEFIRAYRLETAQRLALEKGEVLPTTPECGHGGMDCDCGSTLTASRPKRYLTYLLLTLPIITGICLPVQTLDSSFVKSKGFSFPSFEATADNPGQHQFLKPDTSVFYGKEGYEKVKNKDLADFSQLDTVTLTDTNFLKGMEVIYNFPGSFIDKTIRFTGFAYKGDQVDSRHLFVFRFGFIHCVADSGVFGMLAEFPRDVQLSDNDWVEVSGTLTWQLYQPFKQTIPVLKIKEWTAIPAPEDPYVYRGN